MLKNENFVTLIKKYFNFLCDDYGMKIVLIKEESMGSQIKFASKTCQIVFLLDRTQVFIDIVPPNSLGQSMDLAEIVLYKDPASKFKYALNPDTSVVPGLIRLSELIRKHCDEILKGDFSLWPALVEFQKKRNAELFKPKKDRQNE